MASSRAAAPDPFHETAPVPLPVPPADPSGTRGTSARARIVGLGANVLLATGAVCLAAAALEGAARLVVRARENRPHTTRGSFVRFHPLLGWDKPPGASGWLHRSEYSVFLEVNAKGLRGPDWPYEKPPGVHRTLLLGDSFTEGYTVAETDTMRAVLERELRREDSTAEVINGGTMGYSTDQELLFYRMEGRRYAPDLVVLVFCSNDLYFNTTGEQGKPWFELEEGRLVLRGSPVQAPEVWQRGPEPRRLRISSVRGSMALRLLSERTSEGNPALHRTFARVKVLPPARSEPIPVEMTPLSAVHHAEVRIMWVLMQVLLGELKADVEADGARLAVLYVPDRAQTSERVWDLTRARYGLGPRVDRHRIERRLERLCRDLGIPFLNPRPALVAADASSPGYFPEDGHWNEVGHGIAGATIAAFVRSEIRSPAPRVAAR